VQDAKFEACRIGLLAGSVHARARNGTIAKVSSLGFSQYVVADGQGLAKAIELAERIATMRR
jgi:hypothetical protein